MIIIEHEKSKNYMNKKIILGSAGGAPTESVYNSLKISEDKEEIIGIGADKLELAQSDIKKKYLVPLASSQNYIKTKMLMLYYSFTLLYFLNIYIKSRAGNASERFVA